jgi:uncharacterized membrane protein
MNSEKVLKNLRTFLFGFSIFIFAGSLVELYFLNHTREELQYVPFFLCGIGILLAALMLIKPGKTALGIMRVGMWIVAIGGVVGMTVHVLGNFEMLRQGASLMEWLRAGLGGRNPFLAPGILSMAAAMSLAAGYKYPSNKKE